MLYHKSFMPLPAPYPVFIGADIFARLDLLQPFIASQQILIITQTSVATHFLPQLQQALAAYHCDIHYLAEGEQHKTLTEWQAIFATLLANQHDRNTTLIALGGGMVGDMTGFAAACYQRGVKYLQIPSTLIAQVDAAIGGKTAVNLSSAKNMLGCFYQPSCVIIDISLLRTLPEREYRAGLAEVIKYALIWDKDFFAWLENHFQLLLERDSAALLHAVQVSTAIKMHIVALDEQDRGLRNLLNFGHTIGHALEAALGFQTILHGEAVAIGMWMASHLSVMSGFLAAAHLWRIEVLLQRLGIWRNSFDFVASDVMSLLRHDKKMAAGQMLFIVLTAIGQAERTTLVTSEQVDQVLSEYKKRENSVLPFACDATLNC